ncbi:MAG: transcriptional repressor [Candidatus Muirbacterium halophilum]|nr:transcriptional repressor [Candidatus Muirbacterium halophilum]MCK9476011.1 transcriptional repressor [Candidatus Muirbacterium halophilum]
MRRRRCRCCGKNEDNCNWKDKFAQAGLKFTNPRQYIISIIKTACNPLSAEEVHYICSREYPDIGIGIATVYRNLEILYSLGFISKIDGQDKISRFTIIENPFKIYLQCIKCKNLKDVSNDLSSDTINRFLSDSNKLSQKNSHKLSSVSLVISGICSECV